MGEITLTHQVGEESLIDSAVGKPAAAGYPQRLVNDLLETRVRLLDIAVLVRRSGRIRRRLHAMVGKLGLPAFAIEIVHRRNGIVGPLPSGYSADLS